jgi:chromosomal replication initiation ATPase DnaA
MITLKNIYSAVEKASGFKKLKAKSRKGDLPLWRGMFCKISCELTGAPLREIAETIDRDHATAVYWRKNFEYAFITRPDLRVAYEHIKKELEVFMDSHIDVNKLDLQAEEVIRGMLTRKWR